MNAYIEPFECLIPHLNHEQCEGRAFPYQTKDCLYNRLMSPIDNYCLDNTTGIFRDCMYSTWFTIYIVNKYKCIEIHFYLYLISIVSFNLKRIFE